MFTAMDHFIKDYTEESKSTLKLLNTLTNESLGQKVYTEGRTLGELAWHIVYTISEMMKEAKVELPLLELNENTPQEASKISETYQQYSETLLNELPKQWTDAMLLEEIPMYGDLSWPRGFMLNGFIKHEAHHRGQMTILMRQAGLLVHGVYGPSREEWAAMGLPPQK